MARPLRIQYEGAWYHIMNRGLNHQPIYLNDTHRYLFLELLADIHQRFAVQIHAYCLMDNHYHLLLHTPIANLSRAIRHLDGLYTQRFNKQEGRDGPLFRGRYKSILIDADSYLQQLSRYIHLNPVVANLTERAEDYMWSSYQAFLDIVSRPSWLYCDYILEQFSQHKDIETYQTFTNSGIDHKIQEIFSKPHFPSILGNESFINQIRNSKTAKITDSTEVPKTKQLPTFPGIDAVLQLICDYYRVNLTEVKCRGNSSAKNSIRNLIIYFLSSYCTFSHQEIAIAIGNISATGIAQAKKRGYQSIKSNYVAQENLEELKRKIMSYVKTWPLSLCANILFPSMEIISPSAFPYTKGIRTDLFKK